MPVLYGRFVAHGQPIDIITAIGAPADEQNNQVGYASNPEQISK